MASEIDHEIRDIVDEAYEAARRILSEHLPELHKLAAALIQREKLSGEEFRTIMEGGELPPLEADAPAAPAETNAPAENTEETAESAENAEAVESAETAESAEAAESVQPGETEPASTDDEPKGE